jgi:ferric-dicitrate binding protein FerR (iron transport regulator)
MTGRWVEAELPREYQDLIDAYLHDDVDSKQQARLNRWLTADQANMDTFIEQVDIHAALQETLAPIRGEVGPATAVKKSAGRRRTARRNMSAGLIAGAAFLLVIAGAWLVLAGRGHESALCVTLTACRGEVSACRAGSMVPARRGQLIVPGRGLRTGTAGSATIEYPDGTVIELGGGCRLLLREDAAAKNLRLKRGGLTATVKPQPVGSPFTLLTDQARAVVKGTRFRIEADPERTRLEVESGSVLFAGNLSPGESTTVREGWFAELATGGTLISGKTETAIAGSGLAGSLKVSRIVPGKRPPGPAFEVVRREALRSQQDPGGRPLPLVAHWHRRSLPLSFQLELIEKGYPVLPWLDFRRKMDGTQVREACGRELGVLRKHRLPLLLLQGNQWVGAFRLDDEYRNLPIEKTGLGLNLDGTRMDEISPLSPVQPWRELGRKWTDNPGARELQQLYPDPPLVFFGSNNSPKQLRWHQSETSRRFLDRYGTGRDGEFKRRVFADGWTERYKALFDGMRKGLALPVWKRNIRFVGHNAFGPGHFGRWRNWQRHALSTHDRLGYQWYAWDGSISEMYDRDSEPLKRAYRLWSMQTEAMNLVFMKREAYKVNPEFWFETIFWDGNNWSADTGKAAAHRRDGVEYSPAYYRGWTQYCMWLLTPRVAREWRRSIDDRVRWWHYYQQILDSVAAVHSDPVLQRFWRRGKLVPGEALRHPFRADLPARWKDVQRWYHLSTDLEPEVHAGPDGTVALDTEKGNPLFPVWTQARVIGQAPNREWLLYAFAPAGGRKNVKVTVPHCGTVTVDIPVGGAFYHLVEEPAD